MFCLYIMSDSESEIVYSSESEDEEVVVKPPRKSRAKEEVVKPTRKPRKPLDEDQKQMLRERLAVARERKAQLKSDRQLESAKALIKEKKAVKKAVVKKKVVEPESPPPKPKRVYKKKAAAPSPF